MPFAIDPLFFLLRLTTDIFIFGIVKAQVNIMTRVRSSRTGASGACAGMRATARCAVTIFSEYRRCLNAVFAIFVHASPCIYLLRLIVLLFEGWQPVVMPYNWTSFDSLRLIQ